MQAPDLVDQIASGKSVELTGETIENDLDLRSIQTVDRPFRCLNCIFKGSVIASDVIFQRIVDLTGSHIEGHLDLQGAVFETADLILRDVRDDGTEESRFDRATFKQTAAFDGAVFAGETDFTGARFLGETSFDSTGFGSAVDFEFVTFGPSTLFTGLPGGGETCGMAGSFRSTATFLRAVFQGSADFSQRCFGEDATFDKVSFGGNVDFTLATFRGKARFTGASFAAKASFHVVDFVGAASFQGTSATALDFEGTTFEKGADLSNLTGLQSVSLEQVSLGNKQEFVLNELSAKALAMDVNSVHQVVGITTQERILGLIEETARAAGDLKRANDARYLRLSLEGSQHGPVSRTGDWILYKMIAGYLVRPSHPFLAFLGCLVVGTFIRIRQKRSLLSGKRWLSTAGVELVLASLGHMLTVAFRLKPGITDKEGEDSRSYPFGKLLQYVIFKGLIVLTLMCLASSNPTLREFVDAVRG